MKSVLRKYQGIVDTELTRFADSFGKLGNKVVRQNYDILTEYILRGGKRLRAISCIKSYEAFTGKKERRILLPAISLELYHASSLIHDDIMDEDDMRRGKESMHKLYMSWFLDNFKDNSYNGKIFNKSSVRFSTSAAIIQGNILFSLCLQCLANSRFEERLKNEALGLVQESYREVNNGQLLDLVSEIGEDVTEKDYIEMAMLKTGKLFSTSMELGAIFAMASKKSRKLIHDFGMNVAVAFQIQDDILDVSENMKKGNTFGSDIMQGKRTLIVINALRKASKKQKNYLNKVVGKTNATKNEIRNVVTIFEETGAIEMVKKLADDYLRKGRTCLKDLKKDITSEGYEFFENLALYMTNRTV